MLRLTHDNQEFPVQVGQFLTRVEEVKQLVVGLHNGTPVYLEDIATVSFGVNTATQNVWTGIVTVFILRSLLQWPKKG